MLSVFEKISGRAKLIVNSISSKGSDIDVKVSVISFDELMKKETKTEVQKECYSIKEVMEITGFSRSTINRSIKEEILVAKKVKGRVTIKRVDLDRYLEGEYG